MTRPRKWKVLHVGSGEMRWLAGASSQYFSLHAFEEFMKIVCKNNCLFALENE